MLAIAKRSALLPSFIHLVVLSFFGSCLIISLLILPRLTVKSLFSEFWSSAFLLKAGLLTCAAMVVAAGFYYVLKRVEPFLDAQAQGQACFLDSLDPKYVDVAIVASAALSLFLELAIIRWQSSVLVFLAFYKNFSLLRVLRGWGWVTPWQLGIASPS